MREGKTRDQEMRRTERGTEIERGEEKVNRRREEG
jgi:hypothetical protein